LNSFFLLMYFADHPAIPGRVGGLPLPHLLVLYVGSKRPPLEPRVCDAPWLQSMVHNACDPNSRREYYLYRTFYQFSAWVGHSMPSTIPTGYGLIQPANRPVPNQHPRLSVSDGRVGVYWISPDPSR
jgi:hypothetical protein